MTGLWRAPWKVPKRPSRDESFLLLGLEDNGFKSGTDTYDEWWRMKYKICADPLGVLLCHAVDPISVRADPISVFRDPRPVPFFTADPISTLF